MIRDVFYYGKKPNIHPREKFASSFEDAKRQNTTEHFWIINEFCDYINFDWDFDFDFLPDSEVWAQDHINVWPSVHQKDSGTWLCSENSTYVKIYRQDVNPLKRKSTDKWIFLDKIDDTKFDLSWHPDPTDPPYIYKWGCKFFPPELKHVLEYRVEGATDIKYMDRIVELLPNDYWVENQLVDKTKFDMSWRPSPLESIPYIYVWGNKHIDGTLKSTIAYHTPGATDIKYMPEHVEVLPELDRWKIYSNLDTTNFDLSWRPDPREPAFIYVWGNKWIPGEIQPTVEYHCPGATEIKYMSEHAPVLPELDRWKIYHSIDENEFDLSWRPDPREPAFIYVWGSQWVDGRIEPTIEYHALGATQRKYMEERVKILSNMKNYKILEDIHESSFDFSWYPNPTEPPYIYVFGNQWYPGEIMHTIEYHVEGATQFKYVSDIFAKLRHAPEKFVNTKFVIDFDYSWRPNPKDPPYIYKFGTQWAKTNGPIYAVEQATEVKYMDYPTAIVGPDMSNWVIPEGIDINDFDFSWHPDGTAPPYIYQFGTLIDDIHLEDGPKYITPGHNDHVVLLENKKINLNKIRYPKYYIKTTLEDLIVEHDGEIFWALRTNIDYSSFNFDWIPEKENVFHINIFGSPESETTQTYFVNTKMLEKGYTEKYYVEQDRIIDESYLSELFVKPDMFFVDRGNVESQQRFDELAIRFPNIQKTRYLNTWVDTMNRCCRKTTTELCWVLSSELDYTDFDFNYYPNPWQIKMVHVFGTQWSHWGNTYLINKESFPNDTRYVKIIEHLNMLNFVKSKKAKAVNVLYDIVYIDHGNLTDTENKTVIQYQGNYLDTFKKILEQLPTKKEHYIWIVSSICDYSSFDFTYICDPFSKEQLHVFPSDNQKFGDTFLVNVNKLRELVDNMSMLEGYDKINFNQHQKVNRLPSPVFVTDDTHTSKLKDDYDFPYAIYVTSDNQQLIDVKDNEPISLWNNSKDILITSTGGSRIVVPKEAKSYVKTELYDYPFINKSSKLVDSKPLDIVFFSNGEVGADENYEHLLSVTKNINNRVIRVDGVQGRVASQHAAANASETPWYFLVNAKLRVNKEFNFNWQPDRLQIPKHYIFLATNPVNKLEYGHQAIVANNKTLTLNTNVRGLDFTMDSEHEVVNINSGVGVYNTSEWDTWRTAFREVIKLRNSVSLESKYRLNVWLTIAQGNFAEYSLQGAKDAVDYYESVNGDFEKLRLSYDWVWLKSLFNTKYNQ